MLPKLSYANVDTQHPTPMLSVKALDNHGPSRGAWTTPGRRSAVRRPRMEGHGMQHTGQNIIAT